MWLTRKSFWVSLITAAVVAVIMGISLTEMNFSHRNDDFCDVVRKDGSSIPTTDCTVQY